MHPAVREVCVICTRKQVEMLGHVSLSRSDHEAFHVLLLNLSTDWCSSIHISG